MMLHMPWLDEQTKQACVITCYSVSISHPDMSIFHLQPPHAITISGFQSFICTHACFMGIDMPYAYVHLSYAATACNYYYCFPVVWLCSIMFLSCHYVSIPCLVLFFVIISRTLFWGLLMESILHHLAGRNVSTEQQRSWSVPPLFLSTSIFDVVLICYNPQQHFAGTVDGQYSAPPSGAECVN